jgi:DNA-binding NarL/FixJ family response regulator
MSNEPSPRHKAAPARLVIADDHDLARAGLRAMLTGQEGLEVVGEASNGREALALCRSLKPDLALLDVRMPEMDGLTTCREIKQACPETSVILITMHESLEYLLDALKAGAVGYILKDISEQELLESVQIVLQGESLLNKDIVVQLLKRLSNELPQQEETVSNPLSTREREVLKFLTQGLTNREIAERLFVSVGTVKVHVEHILVKLGVSDRTQAAVQAVERGLLQTSPDK